MSPQVFTTVMVREQTHGPVLICHPPKLVFLKAFSFIYHTIQVTINQFWGFGLIQGKTGDFGFCELWYFKFLLQLNNFPVIILKISFSVSKIYGWYFQTKPLVPNLVTHWLKQDFLIITNFKNNLPLPITLISLQKTFVARIYLILIKFYYNAGSCHLSSTFFVKTSISYSRLL